jgi:hypothetical protein
MYVTFKSQSKEYILDNGIFSTGSDNEYHGIYYSNFYGNGNPSTGVDLSSQFYTLFLRNNGSGTTQYDLYDASGTLVASHTRFMSDARSRRRTGG